MKGIEMTVVVEKKQLSHEARLTGHKAVAGQGLPWLEELKEMADKLDEERHVFQSIQEQNRLENWRLSDLDDTRNEVVLIALAFNHGWGLSYSGKLQSYVARTTADSSDFITAWSYDDKTKPFNPLVLNLAESYHIRFGIYKTENGVKHRFVVKFHDTNPCEIVSSYVSGLDYWARRMTHMKVDDMDNMKAPFRDRYPVYDRLTARWYSTGVLSIIDHQIIQ